MQLRNLKLRNLRSYESADLAFGAGTTLITGDVGSGKTSLLHAIEMALFGFAEVEPTYLVRHQAADSEVQLELEGDGHRYQFGRKFRRRTRRGRDVFELESASYAEDGQRAAYSVTEIRERAIRLLGFPDNPNPRAHSDLWRWAVYVPQERMREVLAQDPEERLQTVRKALGLEQYRTAAENAQLLATELRRLADLRESEARGMDHFAEDAPRLAAEAEARTADHARWSEEQRLRSGDVAAADRALAEIELRRQRAEGDASESRQLSERIRAEETLLGRLEDRRAEREHKVLEFRERLPATVQRAAQLAELRNELLRVEADRQVARADRDAAAELLQELSAQEARCDGARRARDVAIAEVDRARGESESAGTELQALRSEGPQREPPAPTPYGLGTIDEQLRIAEVELDGSVAGLARLEQVLADTDELLHAGVCPRCHQAVEAANFKVHRDELLTASIDARSKLADLRTSILRRQEERRSRERYERNHQRWDELERAREAARSRQERATAHLVGVGNRADQATAELAELERRRLELLPRAEQARTRVEQHARLEARRTELDGIVQRLAATIEEDRQVVLDVERLEEELRAGADERSEHARTLEEFRRQLEEVRARLAGAATLDEETRRVRNHQQRVRDEGTLAARESARAEALAETLRGRLREAQERLEQRTQLLSDGRQRRELATWFSQSFREAVLTLERRLLGRAQSEFERTLARYFALLVEDPGLVARCDPAFSPSVEIDGEWTPPEALSGGERTALALAFRLALGGVVRSAGRLTLETLILDEPTDGFSPEQVVRMGELLEHLGIPQVILVSHEPQLAAVADRIVRVDKRDGRSTLVLETPGGPANVPSASPWEPSRRRRVRTSRLDPPTAPTT